MGCGEVLEETYGFQGVRRGISVVTNRLYKIDCQLIANEDGGGVAGSLKNITETNVGSGIFYRDTNKILQTPTPQTINNDRSLCKCKKSLE